MLQYVTPETLTYYGGRYLEIFNSRQIARQDGSYRSTGSCQQSHTGGIAMLSNVKKMTCLRLGEDFRG